MPTFPLKRDTNYFLPPEEAGIGVKSDMFETPTIEIPKNEPTVDFGVPEYTPDTRATDAFMNLMGRVPQRDTPTLSRKILAGLSTLGKGGLKAGEDILYGDYNRKVSDFETEADLLKDMASAERSANANERLLINQMQRQDIADRRLTETERANRAREENQRKVLGLRQFIADNPSYQVRVDESGEFVAFNPKKPGDAPVRTGVKSGELSELERLGITISAATGRQEDEQAFRKELEALQTENDRKMAEYKAELDKEMAKYRKEQGLSPQEEAVSLFNKANRIYNENPEARRYIQLGEPGTNRFILQRRRALREATQLEYDKEYNRLGELIYGPTFKKIPIPTPSARSQGPGPSNPPTRSTGPNPNRPGTMTKQQRNTRTGELRTLESTDGGKTWHVKK